MCLRRQRNIVVKSRESGGELAGPESWNYHQLCQIGKLKRSALSNGGNDSICSVMLRSVQNKNVLCDY